MNTHARTRTLTRTQRRIRSVLLILVAMLAGTAGRVRRRIVAELVSDTMWSDTIAPAPRCTFAPNVPRSLPLQTPRVHRHDAFEQCVCDARGHGAGLEARAPTVLLVPGHARREGGQLSFTAGVVSSPTLLPKDS